MQSLFDRVKHLGGDKYDKVEWSSRRDLAGKIQNDTVLGQRTSWSRCHDTFYLQSKLSVYNHDSSLAAHELQICAQMAVARATAPGWAEPWAGCGHLRAPALAPFDPEPCYALGTGLDCVVRCLRSVPTQDLLGLLLAALVSLDTVC